MIRCPSCKGDTRVLETRSYGAGSMRRRLCEACQLKLTTIEVIETSREETKLLTTSRRRKGRS
jgi:transcriptional regulator NrdR family protein